MNNFSSTSRKTTLGEQSFDDFVPLEMLRHSCDLADLIFEMAQTLATEI